MNERTNLQLVRIYAGLVSGLALLGVFVYGHLFNIINVDITLDLVRILLAVYLIYVGFVSKSEHSVHTALLVIAVMYIGIGLLGLISPTLGGLLPTGLTAFDIVFHLITGGLAAYAGAGSHRHVAAH